VTLELLWQEYKAGQEDGFQYSAFCDHYRRWRQRLSLSMRQTHTPGEKLFIDYAGQTVAVTDGATGEIKQAQIFVAVLGASNANSVFMRRRAMRSSGRASLSVVLGQVRRNWTSHKKAGLL
jgi:transposase